MLKPGYKTTEFLISLLVIVGSTVAASADWLPPKYAAYASLVSTAAYSVSRGLAKLFPPKPTSPPSVPPTTPPTP